MPSEIITEKRGQIFIITFNRPERQNTLTLDMASQLHQAIRPLSSDFGIRAVLMRGAGGTFMDGLDLEFMYKGEIEKALVGVSQMMLPYHSVVREMNACDKPVVAAVEGRVTGAGLSFMLAADIVVAARSTVFNCKFTSYGMSPDGGASYHLTRKVGSGRAAELLMLNDDFNAEDALRWGIVNRIADDDKVNDEAMALTERLAAGATKAYAAAKHSIDKAFEKDLAASLSVEHTYWGACSRTFDFREAVKALQAKRDRKFTGA